MEGLSGPDSVRTLRSSARKTNVPAHGLRLHELIGSISPPRRLTSQVGLLEGRDIASEAAFSEPRFSNEEPVPEDDRPEDLLETPLWNGWIEREEELCEEPRSSRDNKENRTETPRQPRLPPMGRIPKRGGKGKTRSKRANGDERGDSTARSSGGDNTARSSRSEGNSTARSNRGDSSARSNRSSGGRSSKHNPIDDLSRMLGRSAPPGGTKGRSGGGRESYKDLLAPPPKEKLGVHGSSNAMIVTC
jgi:hypothetical protein